MANRLNDFLDSVEALSAKHAFAPDLKSWVSEIASEVSELRAGKDGAYEERNRCVALIAAFALAAGWRAGVARTAIEGWNPDWHGCVYIELPNGQASWHFHDSQIHLFDWLPAYAGRWDGHDTAGKYSRIDALARDFVRLTRMGVS